MSAKRYTEEFKIEAVKRIIRGIIRTAIIINSLSRSSFSSSYGYKINCGCVWLLIANLASQTLQAGLTHLQQLGFAHYDLVPMQRCSIQRTQTKRKIRCYRPDEAVDTRLIFYEKMYALSLYCYSYSLMIGKCTFKLNVTPE